MAGPLAASAARMARRGGAARGVETCSAGASVAGSGGGPVCGGVGGGGRVDHPPRPPLAGVGRRLAVNVLRQLGETGLDHPQPRARAGRFERELDIGAPRIVLGQPVDLPGEPEHRRLLHPLHTHVDREPVAPPHPGRPTRTKVDRRLIAEPCAQALGRGQRRPHLGRRVSDLHGPLDAIRKTHDSLPRVATLRLPPYSNRLVASTVLPGRSLVLAGDGAPPCGARRAGATVALLVLPETRPAQWA